MQGEVLAQRVEAMRPSILHEVEREEWDYAEADTQHLTHGIHRYSGKFIPQIASRAIQILTQPGELVLDPYCGSGTTLVEAALVGRAALGLDLNPLAVLIAGCKVTPISVRDLADLCKSFAQLVAAIVDREGSLFEPSAAHSKLITEARDDARRQDPWFRKWFQEDVLDDLLVIDHSIGNLEDPRLRTVARVAFSDILRRSSNAHQGYPNVMFDKRSRKKERPGKAFQRVLESICEMVQTLASAPVDWSKVSVREGNATSTGLEDDSVDAIVTHPPYVGSIPYAEYGVLSLKWLGADPKKLDRVLTGGRRQSPDVVQRFRHDYALMFQEAFRVLRPGRHFFVMVGNPVVKGSVVDLAHMTRALAVEAGFRMVAATSRKGINRRANKMGEEALLFFQKA